MFLLVADVALNKDLAVQEEDVKNVLLLYGNKTSQITKDVITEIQKLKQVVPPPGIYLLMQMPLRTIASQGMHTYLCVPPKYRNLTMALLPCEEGYAFMDHCSLPLLPGEKPPILHP